MNGGLISSPRKSVDIGPPNSLISLLAKGSRRNRSKLLERFIFSSQERTSMLNQRLEFYQFTVIISILKVETFVSVSEFFVFVTHIVVGMW